MQVLDDIDQRLVAALRVDGRAPVTQLSRALGVSRMTVNNRLARLVKAGVIVGFTVRIREGSAASDIQAVSLIQVEGRDADRVIAQLRGFTEITALHTTNGNWDLVAEIRVATLADFDTVLGRLRRVPGVTNSETSILLSSVLR